MHTLQEFIRFTKGWEYIIAIIAIFAFVGFWRLVSGGSSGDESGDTAAATKNTPKTSNVLKVGSRKPE